MLSSVVLDVGIGLAFIYLLSAMVCMVVHEWIAGFFGLRAKTLREGIENLLGKEIAKDFYSHPLIRSLSPANGELSYVPSSAFAEALVDLPTVWRRRAKSGEAAPERTFEALKETADKVPERVVSLWARASATTETPQGASAPAQQDVEQLKQDLAKWFDQGMERVSGWYRRWTQFRTVVLAVLVTFLANADTLRIAQRLWESPTLRARVVEEAKVRAAKPAPLLTAEYPDPENPIPSPAPRGGCQGAARGSRARGQAVVRGGAGPARRTRRVVFRVPRIRGDAREGRLRRPVDNDSGDRSWAFWRVPRVEAALRNWSPLVSSAGSFRHTFWGGS